MPWSKVLKRVADLLEIPGDVILNLPRIVLVGNLQVFIENHRGILEYSPQVVRVSISEGELEISGEELVLRNILPEEICVEGNIRAVAFK